MTTRDDLKRIELEIERLEEQADVEDSKSDRSLLRELEKLYNERARLERQYRQEQSVMRERVQTNIGNSRRARIASWIRERTLRKIPLSRRFFGLTPRQSYRLERKKERNRQYSLRKASGGIENGTRVQQQEDLEAREAQRRDNEARRIQDERVSSLAVRRPERVTVSRVPPGMPPPPFVNDQNSNNYPLYNNYPYGKIILVALSLILLYVILSWLFGSFGLRQFSSIFSTSFLTFGGIFSVLFLVVLGIIIFVVVRKKIPPLFSTIAETIKKFWNFIKNFIKNHPLLALSLLALFFLFFALGGDIFFTSGSFISNLANISLLRWIVALLFASFGNIIIGLLAL